uniref:Ribonuclease H-like domain-containing protein n=1 Tax=Tanacetum cinerariifolium TaxID=118510 RepID=A0A699IA76_TANCI|nr:ribonuclease H-like domain-containing protein [Tanacetum cinerariifolium]
MANDEENHVLVAKKEAPTEFALMANTSAESKVFDNSLCSKDCKKNTNSLNSKITDLTDKLFDAKNMIYHYKLGLTQVETRLAEHKDRETKYSEKIIGLEFKTESSDDYIKILKKELDLIKKEKEGLDSKLTCFQTVSKDLDSLFESQRLDKNKEGLGYSVVPPPPAQIYSSPKKDMSWTGLLEFADDTITDYSRPAPTVESSADDAQNRNPFVTATEASPSTISPKPFIKFVKANNSPTNSKTDKAETAKKPPVKYAKQYIKPTKKPNKKVKNGIFKAQNNTHKSFTPRPAVHKPYRLPMTPMRSNMNGAWPNITSLNKSAHINRPFKRTSVKISAVNRKFSTANRKFRTGGTKFSTTNMGKKGKAVKPLACNISYLSNFEPFDGGYVSFGQGGCKITGKGTIKTSKLEFENMYFVKDLKYNLFSTSQICDNKNNVLFTDSECIVFCRNFKLSDDDNVLLRTPR